MFLVNHKRKIAYYAHGKVGSSSVGVTFTSSSVWDQYSDWHDLTGDLRSMRDKIHLLFTQFADYTVYVVIRDPLRRYLSGIKEDIYGPHSWGIDLFTTIEEERQLLSTDPEYILSEKFVHGAVNSYLRPLTGPRSLCSPSMGSFHLENWLYEALLIARYHDNTHLVTTETLTQHVQDTHGIQIMNRNVSPPGLTDRIFSVISKDTQQLILSYLDPEYDVYRILLDFKHNNRDTVTLKSIKLYDDYHDVYHIFEMVNQCVIKGNSIMDPVDVEIMNRFLRRHNYSVLH